MTRIVAAVLLAAGASAVGATQAAWQTTDLGGGGAQYRLSNDEGASLLLRCEQGVVSAGFEFPAPVNARGRAVLRAIPGERRNVAVRPVGERLLQLTGRRGPRRVPGPALTPRYCETPGAHGRRAGVVRGVRQRIRRSGVPPATSESARATGARGVRTRPSALAVPQGRRRAPRDRGRAFPRLDGRRTAPAPTRVFLAVSAESPESALRAGCATPVVHPAGSAAGPGDLHPRQIPAGPEPSGDDSRARNPAPCNRQGSRPVLSVGQRGRRRRSSGYGWMDDRMPVAVAAKRPFGSRSR